jgi:hypothetical protein
MAKRPRNITDNLEWHGYTFQFALATDHVITEQEQNNNK